MLQLEKSGLRCLIGALHRLLIPHYRRLTHPVKHVHHASIVGTQHAYAIWVLVLILVGLLSPTVNYSIQHFLCFCCA